jgi:hypothetical protein
MPGTSNAEVEVFENAASPDGGDQSPRTKIQFEHEEKQKRLAIAKEKLGRGTSYDEQFEEAERSKASFANPVNDSDGKPSSEGAVQLVHLPIDADSHSLRVADLAAAIELQWVAKLKSIFEQAYGDPGRRDGELEWQAEFDQQWAWELEQGCMAERPFQVERLAWPEYGAMRTMTDKDLEDLDNTELMFVELVRSTRVVSLTVGGKTISFTAKVARKCVNMFVVPVKFRVPTAARVAIDSDSGTMTGGVSALKITNWDVAVVWKKLERDSEQKDVFDALMSRCQTLTRDAADASKDLTDDDLDETDREDVIVQLFTELCRDERIECHLNSDDICDFMDKSRIDDARAKCAKWGAKATWAKWPEDTRKPSEYAEEVSAMLDRFEQTIIEILTLVPCPMQFSADDVSDLLDEKRLVDIVEDAAGIDSGMQPAQATVPITGSCPPCPKQLNVAWVC